MPALSFHETLAMSLKAKFLQKTLGAKHAACYLRARGFSLSSALFILTGRVL